MQIGAAVDHVLSNTMGQNMTKDDYKDLIETIAATLKDEDPVWIDFDDAPRVNTNPIYSCIY